MQENWPLELNSYVTTCLVRKFHMQPYFILSIARPTFQNFILDISFINWELILFWKQAATCQGTIGKWSVFRLLSHWKYKVFINHYKKIILTRILTDMSQQRQMKIERHDKQVKQKTVWKWTAFKNLEN